MFTAGTRPEAHAGLFALLPARRLRNDDHDHVGLVRGRQFTQKYMSIWHPPWPPGFPEAVQVSDTPLSLDTWTCVEWLFDGKNEADATEAAMPRVWLDGTELAWPTKFAFSEEDQMNATPPKRNKATNFTVFETGITLWQSMPTANNWWIDDIGIGPERVGCN